MLKSFVVLLVILYALFVGVPSNAPQETPPAAQMGLSAGEETVTEAAGEESPPAEIPTPALEPEFEPAPEPAVEDTPPAPQETPVEQPAPAEESSVVGSWLWEIDTAPVLSAAIKQELPEIEVQYEYTDLKLLVNIHLFEDGSFTAAVTEESAWAWRENFIAQTEELLMVYLEQMIAQSGLNMSVERFMEVSGLSVPVLMEELANEVLGEDQMQSLLSVGRGYYALWDGKVSLYWGTLDESSYDYYTLSGDTLIIEEGTGVMAQIIGLNEFGDYASFIYPAVLTRGE